MPEAVTIDTARPGVALLSLNRPERLNAINETMIDELRRHAAAITADPECRAVVLTGTGRGFCSGIDIRDFGPSMADVVRTSASRLRFQEMMGSLPGVLRELPQPVIAAVNGPCVGGGLALCLAADIRICSSAASFGNAAILLGLSGAEMGMSYHLPRVVGVTVAADWMLTGRTVSSEEADRRGLVSEVVPPERLVDRALEIAVQISELAPLGVYMTKRALQANVDAPSLAAALEIENRNQVLAYTTDEAASRRAQRAR